MRKVKNPWTSVQGYDCIGCAPNNPNGLHMEFYADDDLMVGVWKVREHFDGWTGVIHGGIQSLLLDETGAWWVYYFKQSATVTSRLNVKFVKTVESQWDEIVVKAKFVKDMKSFVVLQVELFSPLGDICASAEAVYYVVPRDKAENEYGFTKCELEEEA